MGNVDGSIAGVAPRGVGACSLHGRTDAGPQARGIGQTGTSRSLVGASHSSGKMPTASAWARPLEFRRSAGSEMENDGQTELAAGRRCRDLWRRRRRSVSGWVMPSPRVHVSWAVRDRRWGWQAARPGQAAQPLFLGLLGQFFLS